MKMTKVFGIILGSLIVSSTFAAVAERSDEIDGVKLESGKLDSSRFYKGTVSKTYPYSIEQIKASVMNFDGRCNNEFKDKRIHTDKTQDCKFHNANLVESVVVKNIHSGWTKEENEVERLLVARRVYNRGSYAYNEIVKVYEYKNDQNQKVVKINQRMIDDSEAKKYADPIVSKDSAFDTNEGTFILTQISPTETKMDYTYDSATTHWILNKEVSVPQVFSSISKSLNDLISVVDKESAGYSRAIAAE